MEQTPNVKIEESWKLALASEFVSPYFADIKKFLVETMKAGHKVYPPGPLIFNAFNKTPFNQVKGVILGQDPYHNPGEAMGLSFSVPRGIKTPPSLVNIYKEIRSELGYEIPAHGDLSSWAEQGVLMLNAMLTVEAGKPASQNWLANIHGCSDSNDFRQKRRGCLHAVGQLRPEQEAAH